MEKTVYKKLNNEELKDALGLHHECLYEEFDQYNISVKRDFEYELQKLVDWVNEDTPNDVRIVYGAFDDNLLIGFGGASYAEEKDFVDAIEINYLFVNKNFRGRKIGLTLMHHLVHELESESRKHVVLYNWHVWKSNNFYFNLGGALLRQEFQRISGEDQLVDVFYWKIPDLMERLEEKLK